METFIGSGYIDCQSCDELIQYFEDNPHKKPGRVGGPESGGGVKPKDKISTDVSMHIGNPINSSYLKGLEKVLQSYIAKYEGCVRQKSPWTIEASYNIQKYRPGEGFFNWHCENSGFEADSKRHLAFITYLNTVKVGGGTEFKYFDVVTEPIKGNTVIFPAHWPHTHRGVVAPEEVKYIATGWFSYK
jgi:hypothetical protein